MIHLKLKELRKQRGLSQVELAKEIHVSSGNVGDWERGRAKPGFNAIIALANYYQITTDSLLLSSPSNELLQPDGLADQSSGLLQEKELLEKYRLLGPQDKIAISDEIGCRLRASAVNSVKKGM